MESEAGNKRLGVIYIQAVVEATGVEKTNRESLQE